MKPTRLLSLSVALVAASGLGVPIAGASPRHPAAITSAPAPEVVTCRGLPAQVVAADEDFVGTDGDDVIVVIGSGAEVWGNFGDDLICLAADPYHGSVAHGGPDDDIIISYSGSHTVTGDAGADVLIANGGAADVDGGSENDIINVGGASSSLVHAGAGNDIVNGGPGNDTVYGNAGNDLILGWSGHDTLYGDEGNDTISGGLGWDGLGGGAGTDACHDLSSALDGGMYGECESVVETPSSGSGFVAG